MLRAAIYSGALLLALLSHPLQADTVRVAVASNFAPTLKALAADFTAQTGYRISPASGSTGRHYAQIVNGAPYELFLAADRLRPTRLEAEGFGVPASRRTYALGRLVLWAPALPASFSLDQALAASTGQRLAIANARLAPYGSSALAWLGSKSADVESAYRLVRGDNVAQAFQFIASGNAELGLVAHSQMLLSPEPLAGLQRLIPATNHQPIEQQLLLLRETPAARALYHYLLSARVQGRLDEFGYDQPHVESR